MKNVKYLSNKSVWRNVQMRENNFVDEKKQIDPIQELDS